MFLSSFQRLMLVSFILLMPTLSYALSGDDVDKFKKECNMYWMKDSEKASDKTEYQNFGEKYCGCMSKMPLDSDSDMKSSAKVCMTRTLLHSVMENLGEDPGLSELTAPKIEDACVKEWDYIGNVLVGKERGNNSEFCKCAAPKLNDMNNKRDDMTDDAWESTINSIAKDCS